MSVEIIGIDHIYVAVRESQLYGELSGIPGFLAIF